MNWLLIASMLVGACSRPLKPLRIFAAAGAKPAIDEVIREFQARGSIGIEVSYGGAGEILTRMVFSEMGDVFIAPEQEFMKRAAQEGAVDPATIRSLAYMVPALAVPRGNPKRVTDLSDLADPGVRIAISRPETTAVGRYATEIFRKAGLKEEIANNTVTQAARPDLLITWLTLGEVDVAITWHFYGSLAPDDVEIIPLPPELLTGVGEMQVAIATYSRNEEAARSFRDFLTSAEAKAIFQKHGYIVDKKQLTERWTSGGP